MYQIILPLTVNDTLYPRYFRTSDRMNSDIKVTDFVSSMTNSLTTYLSYCPPDGLFYHPISPLDFPLSVDLEYRTNVSRVSRSLHVSGAPPFSSCLHSGPTDLGSLVPLSPETRSTFHVSPVSYLTEDSVKISPLKLKTRLLLPFGNFPKFFSHYVRLHPKSFY